MIRYLLESLVEILIAVVLASFELKFNSISEGVSSVATIVMVATLVIFIYGCVQCIRYPKLKDVLWLERYQEFFAGIKIDVQKSRSFVLLFIMRRIAFVGILCFVPHSYF